MRPETARPRVHDLLRIRPDAARFAVPPEDWVLEALEAAPWVVARRAAPIANWIPVGIRGETRDQRQPAQVSADDILQVLRPEDLSRRCPLRPHVAFEALVALAPTLDRIRCPWGPIGAAGFELASGRPTLRVDSDLDIAIRADRGVRLDDLRSLRSEMRNIAIRVDILVETRRGGVAIEEALGDAAKALARSASGPIMLSRRELEQALSAVTE